MWSCEEMEKERGSNKSKMQKCLSKIDKPAISMDWSGGDGQKVKDLNARLQSPVALSIHMECHTLFIYKQNSIFIFMFFFKKKKT